MGFLRLKRIRCLCPRQAVSAAHFRGIAGHNVEPRQKPVGQGLTGRRPLSSLEVLPFAWGEGLDLFQGFIAVPGEFQRPALYWVKLPV